MSSEIITPADLFNCQRCGDCCKGFGGTSVSDEDIRQIAAYTQIAPQKLQRDYIQIAGRRQMLGQKDNGYCIFWDGLCTIHPVKPRMCRQWPFISSLLVDINNWHMMASTCPGMRTDLPDHLLLACVQQELLR